LRICGSARFTSSRITHHPYRGTWTTRPSLQAHGWVRIRSFPITWWTSTLRSGRALAFGDLQDRPRLGLEEGAGLAKLGDLERQVGPHALRHPPPDQVAGVGLAVQVETSDRLPEKAREKEDAARPGGGGLPLEKARIAEGDARRDVEPRSSKRTEREARFSSAEGKTSSSARSKRQGLRVTAARGSGRVEGRNDLHGKPAPGEDG